jgi:hypothetical protein
MSEAAAGAGPREATGSEGRGQGIYLASLLAGGLFAFLGFMATLQGLQTTGHLPPPALTNNLCLDEKLDDLRERHPQDQPTVLIVGSSVAWRHFDGDALRRRAPEAVPLNGGFCGLRMNQTERAAKWLLSLYPTARQVVAIASPTDFEDCVAAPSALFDPEDARDYVLQRRWWWTFYLRYFSPLTLAQNAWRIAPSRRNEPGAEPFMMTRWGDAPLPERAHPEGLRYPRLTGLDPGCFTALRRLATEIEDGGRQFVLVLNPVHPEWVSRFGMDDGVIDAWRIEARNALAGTTATFWDAHVELGLSGAAFYDAIHLLWPAARCFTAKLVVATGLAGSAAGTALECAEQGLRVGRPLMGEQRS